MLSCGCPGESCERPGIHVQSQSNINPLLINEIVLFATAGQRPGQVVSKTPADSKSPSDEDSEAEDMEAFMEAKDTIDLRNLKPTYEHPHHDIPQATLDDLEFRLRTVWGIDCPLLRNPPPPAGRAGSCLGSGVSGQVHLGHRLASGGFESTIPRRVAVKLTPTSPTARPTHVVPEEIRLLKAIESHPNIMSILGTVLLPYDSTQFPDRDSWTSIVIMELLTGGTLGHFMDEIMGGVIPLPAPLGRGWIASLVDGLHHLHTKAKVAHCDLHAGNLMLNGNGNLKLVDLGHARKIPSDTDQGEFEETRTEIIGAEYEMLMNTVKFLFRERMTEADNDAARTPAGFLVTIRGLLTDRRPRPLLEVHTESRWLAEDPITKWFHF